MTAVGQRPNAVHKGCSRSCDHSNYTGTRKEGSLHLLLMKVLLSRSDASLIKTQSPGVCLIYKIHTKAHLNLRHRPNSEELLLGPDE